jgi:large subunit ribosomal protein L25
MLTLSAKIRQNKEEKPNLLRKKGLVPAVLYGPKIKNYNIAVNEKDFKKVFSQAGESSLIKLELEKENFYVLVHDIARHPLKGSIIHIDFYQPDLEKDVEVSVPIVIEGEAPAVKELGGTLVKNLSNIVVKSLPHKLPKEIKVDVSSLKTFDDHILVKNLVLPEGVKIVRGENDIVVFVAKPEKVEEELQKPIEEKVEEVKVVEKKKPSEEEVEQEDVKK